MKITNQALIIILTLGTYLLISCEKEVSMNIILYAESIELLSGNGQSAEIEDTLFSSIVIIVKDQNGDALAGYEVNFTVIEGSVSATQAVTDTSGKISIDWILGSSIGKQALTITCFNENGDNELSGSPLIVEATGLALPTAIADIDNNIYNVVKIGNQLWMTENLRVLRYNDGSEIPLVQDSVSWMNLTTGAYCIYDNVIENKETYGSLYNWHAVESAKLCPVGWHVPTVSEMDELRNYLSDEGFINSSGIVLKATSGWENDGNGTDLYGFNGLPGGRRSSNSTYFGIGRYCSWWSATKRPADNFIYYYSLSNQHNLFYRANGVGETSGMSIRCIRD